MNMKSSVEIYNGYISEALSVDGWEIQTNIRKKVIRMENEPAQEQREYGSLAYMYR